MATLLRLPEPAAGATSAVVSEWPIAENAPYTVNAAIVVIETEKASIEIEAESDGVLLKRLVPAGTEVAVGTPIALLGSPGEQPSDIDALLTDLGVTSAALVIEEQHEPVQDSTPQRVFASPLARRLARLGGLTIDQINGTGPGGRIVRRDVEEALARATPPPLPAAEPVAPVPAAGYVEVPHSRVRRAIATRLVESKQTTPHFYVRGTARAEQLLAARAQLNRPGSPKISVNDLVIKAVARAHVLVPEMNSMWTPDAVRRFTHVDVAVAVATDTGLVTPVLREVDTMPITAVAETTRRYADSARNGRLRQHELEGGTVTVTNMGMFGTEEFAAIINPPQSSILSVGAARTEPVVDNGAVVPGTTIRFVLSVDHRPIDGTVAARWMAEFLALIENPVRVFA
ncbi:pyruvate dehydrogenase complex dihydrolipoamide acetyltransferase [Acrocarpospora macrocephala]|uniref:Dihydrolipoamide acetyltransferase component of pyruvate dehydrogenase complex n=1 Tax=Acrocarpospora macrocephala TaxID=150177 RepID=A0A5M3WVP0_9ACTN|nr:dihydrolipoamide acetyltransferase family protein [Acrocarpospora macrocephala]GES10208.1 acetyltransferase component of pyruvate dehydrogenase complex [Acrocarpospora macrocephala]